MLNLSTKFAAALAVVALALTGCASGGAATSASTPAASASSQSWPRTITHTKGETTINAKPTRIVSTSPTLTGTLLAIGAPVVASAATTPSDITDDKGFFGQWSKAAAEKGVEVLYPNLEFNEEAVLAADPDLIVVSATGADATADQYDKLSAIAPTIVLNYGSASWQNLAGELAKATGQPILPFHVEAAPAWHARSWDRAQIPKPFSRIAVAVGEPMRVDPDADEAGLEQRRLDLESALSRLRDRAAALLQR